MPDLWLLCSYRLPREPTRLRLAVWRRLKRIGAVMLHDSLWVLPQRPEAQEDFEWLAEEIEEQGGTALLWEARSLPAGQDAQVIDQFRRQSQAGYQSITAEARRLAARKRSTPQSALRALQELQRELGREKRRDYFRIAEGRIAVTAVEQAGAAIHRGSAVTKPVRR
jgi:hypothetical protein